MSDKNNNDAFFSNQDTIVRRAWINSALEGVRSRLASGSEPDAAAAHIEGANAGGSASEATAAGDGAVQPNLYVAWSSQQRRSGT